MLELHIPREVRGDACIFRESQQKPRMGAKASTETGVRTYSNVGQGSSAAMESSGGQHAMVDVGGAAGHRGARARPRTRSLGTAVHRGHPLVFTGGSPDSDDSTPEDRPRSRSLVGAALPFHLFSFHGKRCSLLLGTCIAMEKRFIMSFMGKCVLFTSVHLVLFRHAVSVMFAAGQAYAEQGY